MKLIDLSLPVREGTPSYPGFPKTRLLGREGVSFPFSRATLHLSDDTLTRVEFPPLWDDPKGSIGELPPEMFSWQALCLDLGARGGEPSAISARELEEALSRASLSLQGIGAALIYTGHSERFFFEEDPAGYLYSFTGLGAEGALWLIEAGVSAIGIDGPSVDPFEAVGQGRFPAHELMRERKVVGIENLAGLGPLLGRRFTLMA
ncbi:MAG: cyclase family protein, partial [Nitrospinota bacterium]